MGMRATYRYLSDKNLKELKSYYGIEDKIQKKLKIPMKKWNFR